MSRVKFSVFADLHHYPAAFYSRAPERLTAIQQRALRERVDCILSLGDFCHDVNATQELIGQFQDCPIPSYHILGNHDTDRSTLADALRLYRMPDCYYHFDVNGFRFVAIDTNYVRIDGRFEHFELGNYYGHPDTREILPPEELEWLRRTLLDSPFPCILLSHASIERESRPAVGNRDEVVAIIREANAHTPGKVRLAINGHHHRDFLRILENVAYLDLNSTTFEWINHPHSFFPAELCARHEFAANTVIYNDPVHAVITVDGDGTIEIAGMTSSMFMGVTREMTDNPPCDHAGRPCTPNVLSARFKMFY